MSIAERAVPARPDLPSLAGRFRLARPASRLGPTLVALDASGVAAGWWIAWTLRPPVSAGWSGPVSVLALTAAVLAVFHARGLYRSRVCSSRIAEIAGVARSSVMAAAGAFVAFHLAGGEIDPVGAGFGAFLAVTFLGLNRGYYDAWLRGERSRGRFTRPVVVIGVGDEVGRVLDLLRHHDELGHRVVGLVGGAGPAAEHGVPWLGPPNAALRAVLASGATGAILVQGGMDTEQLNRLVRDLLAHGVHVRLSSGLWSIDSRRLRVTPLAHEPFLYLETPSLTRTQLAVKRALDVTLSGLAVTILAPVFLACAVAVKAGDRGPVLFRQVRIGRDGRPFTLLKFRTMVVGAEASLSAVSASNQRHGPLFKLENDPRQTRVGRILRAVSLDELPQLLNVLAGTMSLVGPRPALPAEVARFDADLHDRHRLRPGVTGLWQVEARDNASFYAYRHLDLFYVENWSSALDLVILAGTLPAVAARAVRALRRGHAVDAPA